MPPAPQKKSMARNFGRWRSADPDDSGADTVASALTVDRTRLIGRRSFDLQLNLKASARNCAYLPGLVLTRLPRGGRVKVASGSTMPDPSAQSSCRMGPLLKEARTSVCLNDFMPLLAPRETCRKAAHVKKSAPARRPEALREGDRMRTRYGLDA